MNSGFADLHSGFAGLHSGFADLHSGFADLHSGFADLHSGFADLHSGSAAREGPRQRSRDPLRRPVGGPAPVRPRPGWLPDRLGGPRPGPRAVSHAVLSLHRPDAADPLAGGGELRPPDEVLADARALPAPTGWVVLTGPASHPALAEVVRALGSRGLRVALETGSDGLDADALQALAPHGLAVVRLALHGGPEAHAAVTGDPAGHARLVAVAEALARAPAPSLELVAAVTRANADDLPALVARAAGWGARLHLRRPPPGTATRLPALRLGAAAERRALAAARAAADALGVPLALHGLEGPPPPVAPAEAPVPATRHLWTFLRDDVHLPTFAAGCRLAAAPAAEVAALVGLAGSAVDLGHQLAAWGCPPVDLPPCLGGPGRQAGRAAIPPALADRLPGDAGDPLPVWTPAPGRRVALVVPGMADKVLVLSTLPALAGALRELGADVAWWSAFGPPAPLAEAAAARQRAGALDDARAGEAALWRDLDLSDRDLVVVPGFEAGERVLLHPTLPPHARVVIADLHLLHGIDRWKRRWVPSGRRSMDGGWWPSDRVHVHSCFPSFVRLYRFAGIPLRQVLWRPYPVDPAALPEVDEAPVVFAGGNQLRDWATLAAAVGRLGGRLRHPVELTTRSAPPGALPAGLTWRGTVDLPAFLARVAASRAVVLPVPFERHVASGLTVAALALAAGRPVIASRTPGLRDHVRHGAGGLLVTPRSPAALADALARLDGDEALRGRLAAGARAAGARASAAVWARELLLGADPERVVGPPGGPYAPWGPPHAPERAAAGP